MLQADRRYELTIGNYRSGDGTRVTDLQIQFDVSQSADNKKSSNSATVEVYNLSRETLGKLETEFLECTLAVGYRDTGVQTILTGNVVETRTVKRGVDQVTQFILGEGYTALNHKRIKSLVAPGKTKEDVIEEIRKQMPGVARGAYVGTNLSSPILYGYPLNGSPKKMLDRFAKENKLEWRLVNNTLYVSDENGLTSRSTDEAVLISAETGLIDIPFYSSGELEKLDTDPKRRTGVQFKALINPNVQVGKLIRLESTVMPVLNGFYRVAALRYYGDYRGNDWYMDCVCKQVFNVELMQ